VTRAADRPVDPPDNAPTVSAGSNRVEHLEPPVIEGQYDSSASVTAVATFHACPRKYQLGTIAKPEYEVGDGAIETGLAVHRILAGGAAESQEHAELAARFTQSELGRRAARATRIEREFDFLLYLEDVVLRGQMDVWFEESGELVLVDYKTDRDESSAAAHALQLQLYALALEKYAGRLPDRAALYYLRSDRIVDVSLDALEEARAAVHAFRDAQESGQFPLKPGAQCRRCAYFENLCPAQL